MAKAKPSAVATRKMALAKVKPAVVMPMMDGHLRAMLMKPSTVAARATARSK